MRFGLLLVIPLMVGCNSSNEPSGQYAPIAHGSHVRLEVMVGGKRGFIDETGKLVINPQWDAAYPFKEGLALVCVGECDGEHLLGRRYTKDFKEIILEQTFKYGYIDESGKFMINPSYEDAHNFSEGLAAVCQGKGCYRALDKKELPRKWGYIDKTGSMVISPQFDAANNFKEDLASASVGGKWGYIDKKGTFVINPQFDNAGDFDKGFATIAISAHEGESTLYKWGYIDKTSKVIWEPSK